MAILTLHVKDSILDKVLWLLGQFDRAEVEVMSEGDRADSFGPAMTPKQFRADIREAEKEFERGEFDTLEEFEKASESWD